MSRTVQTVQHFRGHRRVKSGPKDKTTSSDRWQRPTRPRVGQKHRRRFRFVFHITGGRWVRERKAGGWHTSESVSRPPAMAVAIAKTVVPCHTCKLNVRMSRTVQTVQHTRGHRRSNTGPKDKPTFCDRSERPTPTTSGATALRQISIRFFTEQAAGGCGNGRGGDGTRPRVSLDRPLWQSP